MPADDVATPDHALRGFDGEPGALRDTLGDAAALQWLCNGLASLLEPCTVPRDVGRELEPVRPVECSDDAVAERVSSRRSKSACRSEMVAATVRTISSRGGSPSLPKPGSRGEPLVERLSARETRDADKDGEEGDAPPPRNSASRLLETTVGGIGASPAATALLGVSIARCDAGCNQAATRKGVGRRGSSRASRRVGDGNTRSFASGNRARQPSSTSTARPRDSRVGDNASMGAFSQARRRGVMLRPVDLVPRMGVAAVFAPPEGDVRFALFTCGLTRTAACSSCLSPSTSAACVCVCG
jgi:hypothetical protein